MPFPLRWVVGTRLGSFLLIVGLPVLLVTGVMTIEWDNTGPHFRFHRERAKEIRQEIHTEAVNTVRQYQDRLPNGADSNFFGSRAGSNSQGGTPTTLAPPPYQAAAPSEGQRQYPANPPYPTSPPYQPAPTYQNGLAPNPTARAYDWNGATR